MKFVFARKKCAFSCIITLLVIGVIFGWFSMGNSFPLYIICYINEFRKSVSIWLHHTVGNFIHHWFIYWFSGYRRRWYRFIRSLASWSRLVTDLRQIINFVCLIVTVWSNQIGTVRKRTLLISLQFLNQTIRQFLNK